MAQLLWETVWRHLKRINIELPYDLATLLLGTQPKELQIYVHTEVCAKAHGNPIHYRKMWKQQKCPLTDERINKCKSIHSAEKAFSRKRTAAVTHVPRLLFDHATLRCHSQRLQETSRRGANVDRGSG